GELDEKGLAELEAEPAEETALDALPEEAELGELNEEGLAELEAEPAEETALDALPEEAELGELDEKGLAELEAEPAEEAIFDALPEEAELGELDEEGLVAELEAEPAEEAVFDALPEEAELGELDEKAAFDALPEEAELGELEEKAAFDALPEEAELGELDEKAALEALSEKTIIDTGVLASLSECCAETANNLSSALEELISAEDESEAVFNAVEHYTESLQPLWTASEEAGLPRLTDIYTFINDNVMALGMESREVRQAAQDTLEMWPVLLLSYLGEPPEGAAELAEYLQDPHWPSPLEAEAALALQTQLEMIKGGEGIAADAEILPETVETESAATEVPELAPEAVEQVTAALTEASEQLSATLETLVSAENDSEALLEAVGQYTEIVQPLWDATEAAGLNGLQSVCDFVNENVMALGMQEQSERQAAQIQFELWPGLVLDYLVSPVEGADELAVQLQDSQWPSPLPAEEAAALRSSLLLPVQVRDAQQPVSLEKTPEAPPAPGEEVHLGEPDVVDMLRTTVTDSAEGLSAALEAFVSMDNSNEAFLEAIETYTNHVQAIWETAEMAGLGGLQEVCTFMNDNLMALSGEEQAARQALHMHFEQWPALVLDYLSSPAEGANVLIEHLQNSQWPEPLTTESAQALLANLLRGAVAKAEEALPEEAPVEEPEEEKAPIEMGEEKDISLGNAEMLEMLRGEIEESKEDLEEALKKFTSLQSDDAAFSETAEYYTELVERLAGAAEMMGLPGLHAVCSFIMENAKELSGKDQKTRAAAQGVLEKWPELVSAYLEAPKEHVIALLNHLRETQWPSPLPDEQAHALLNTLTQSSEGPEEEPENLRQVQAKPEDVLLNIPPDVNQELLDAFLQEAPQHATEFSASIQKIIQSPDPEELKLAQRTAHTLKGSSNIIGIKGIASLAHHLEDIMEFLAEQKMTPPKPLTDTMMEAADTLEVMVDVLLGKEQPPPEAITVLQSVLDWANRIDKGNLEVSEEELKKQRESAPAPQAAPAPAAAPRQGAGPAVEGGPEQFLKVPTRTIDNLLRLVGEMSISVGQIHDRLKNAMQNTKSLNQKDLQVQHKTYELETLVDVRDVTNRKKHRGSMTEEQVEEEAAFDSLEFEQYNELHSCTHSFIESIADSRELGTSILEDLNALDGIFVQQERLNKEFQEIVMSTRMEPVKGIMSRLERIVRQTCRTTNKKANFEMRGGDNLMDGEVLSKLTDPLLHILRNSVDHGMETPEERIAAGKPEAGLVVLNVFRQGNNIVVRCEDDGRGLNFDNIRKKAVEKGLLKENQEVSRRELGRMIFIAGFSTKGQVTQVSGRGVGMDVVHSGILALKGSVDIESEPGQGTAIILTLPMTLITMHVLLVQLAGESYAIPTTQLEQALTPESGKFRQVGTDISFHMQKNAYPAMSLNELLHLPGEPVSLEDTRPLLLVRGEGGATAVLVDTFIESRDLVAKKMSQYVTNIKGVSGATILGDGSVIPVLDLPELLRTPAQMIMPTLSSGEDAEAGGAAGGIPHILIVDDSLSVRKSLSQLVEDAGYETLLAKDGLEAIEVVGQTKPNVMLVDMEMPRMNGIELTTHIRGNENTKSIPIFMITSRTTEKHRELARTAGVNEYLTKPYPEAELLKMIESALSG
ncbi:MAG: hybrid sensor histidine kinase/response regulator, partial [Gammaproteobacteria bacterium]|nr:hybrid sensor histidine kinase/response regulator [Gammaproteobacteria bacterium]